MFCIYKITNLVNGKFYIGKTTLNKYDSYWGSGRAIKAAIKKYGKEHFIKEVLELTVSEKEAYELEEKWINIFDAYKSSEGYNMIPGGRGFSKESSENAYKAFLKLPEEKKIEIKNKRAEALRTKETRKKIGEASKRAHEKRDEKERLLLNKKMSEGWGKEEKEKQRQRMLGSKRNGASGCNLNYLIDKYGKEEGTFLYWKGISDRKISLQKNVKERSAKCKNKFEFFKKVCPHYNDFKKAQGKLSSLKIKYKKGSISEKELQIAIDSFKEVQNKFQEEKKNAITNI